MKIIADENIPYVKEAFAESGVVVSVPGKEITKDVCKDATILLVRSVTRVDEDLLDSTAVKFVGTATVGIDHIDTGYLEDQTIGFASAPGSNANSVSEYVVAALLQLEYLKKCSLRDCTIGIIGVGNVGSRVFRMAQALGIRCLLNDPPKKRMTSSDFYLPQDEVLSESDIVTLHVPLTQQGPEKTYHLVDRDFLEAMKNDSILINTSRGKVIDEETMCETGSKKMGGLVIDVWESEPAINLDFLSMTDIASAHIAGYSFNGKLNGIKMIHDAACAFFYKNKKWQCESILDKQKGETINLSKSENPVYDAVKKAYSIMKDDENIRKIVNLSESKPGPYFEELRKKYRKRLEFSQFVISSNEVKKEEADVLQELGFQVN